MNKKRSLPYKLKDNKELLDKFVKVNRLAKELYNETTQEKLGELIGVSKQAIGYHERKDKKHE